MDGKSEFGQSEIGNGREKCYFVRLSSMATQRGLEMH